MKLYTEEQVKDAFIKGILKGMAGSTLSTYELFEMYINDLTPIELPSDEEIEKELLFGDMINGAIWMKKQILNQNK